MGKDHFAANWEKFTSLYFGNYYYYYLNQLFTFHL